MTKTDSDTLSMRAFIRRIDALERKYFGTRPAPIRDLLEGNVN